MNLAQMFPDIEFSEGYSTCRDGLGNTFLTVTSGGIKEEGAAHHAYFTTRELAEDAFLKVFTNLSDGCSNVCVRQAPRETVYRDFEGRATYPSLYSFVGRYTFIRG